MRSWLVIWLVLLSAPWAAAERLRIAWFAELDADHGFWRQHLAFSQAVAEDLDMELVPFFAEGDQGRYRRQLAAVVSGAEGEFDGAVVVNMKHQERRVMAQLDKGSLPAISNVLPMDPQRVGQPRQNHPNWIGEISVDEVRVGRELARRLLGQARYQDLADAEGKIQLLAIGGNPADRVGIQREQGLQQAVAQADDVVLHQVLNAPHWSKEEGERLAFTALRRYPDTAVIWAANDEIALGVVAALERLGKAPGQVVLTGGIDGTREVVQLVQEGKIHCTVSGLFAHGGWSLVLLHDYLKGQDFFPPLGPVVEVPSFIIDATEAERFLELFGNDDWNQVNFADFSRVLNPLLPQYDLSLSALYHHLAPRERP